MDDEGKSVYNQTILHTRAFKLEDVEYLQSVLSQPPQACGGWKILV